MTNGTKPNPMGWWLRTAGTVWLVPLLLLLALPAAVQAQFTFATNGGALTITGYTGFGGTVVIPSATNGLPVTSIGDNAFFNKSRITNVSIPNSVTSIGSGAFFVCMNLTSATIPSSVTSIGDYAFASCTELTSVTIPNSVTSIGSGAFSACTNLPAISVDTLNAYYCSVDGVLFDKGQTTLLQCPGGKPGGVTIPSGVTSIASRACSSCTRLTSVSIPSSVTNIGSGAFSLCTILQAISVDTLNGYYCSVDGVLFDKGQTTLLQCPGGKPGSVTIPDSVTSIGSGAFYQCKSLTGVTIPKSVTSIESSAFYYCTSLTAITVSTFNASYCSVGGVLYDKSQTTLLQCPGGKTGGVTIPSGVTSIAGSAFSYCISLTSVTIPSSVTKIVSSEFYNCTNLTAITVDTLNTNYSSVDGVLFDKAQRQLLRCPGGKAGGVTIPGGVTSIANSAFYNCKSLTGVSIPNSVTSIGNGAFYYCTSLTGVTIPSSVTSIEGTVFYYCTSLTSITIPSGVTSIGSYAFGNCANLTSVTIPNSVTSIVSSAFSYCTGLNRVTIPNSVTSIGGFAFASCTRLEGVYFNGNAPSADSSVFSSADGATVYYLPGTTGWGTTFGGRPTALWKPEAQTSNASFGVRTNRFGFNINWASGRVVVVEACTNLVNPIWYPVGTNTLTSGASYFSDPRWTNYPTRLYRLRSL